MRKSEAENAHHHGRSRGQKKRDGGGFDSEASDRHANRDPSQRAENANQREIAASVFQVLQCERVGESDGWEVAETVNEHQSVDRAKAGRFGDKIEEHGAQKVQSGENPLRDKESVRAQASKKRRD